MAPEEPHIDIDWPTLKYEQVEGLPIPAAAAAAIPTTRERPVPWCRLFVSGWFLTSTVSLILGLYFQFGVCAKYPSWANVWCNTTHFRAINTLYSGTTGFVTADYLNGECHSPEFQVFACTDMDHLQECVTAGRLNYDVSGQVWPCYMETAVCGGNTTTPVVQAPSNNTKSGCQARIALLITGSVMMIFFCFFCCEECFQRR